jgi:hypothetical protein
VIPIVPLLLPSFGDRFLGEIIVGDVMLTLPCRTIDDRNVVRFGVARTVD